MKNLASFIIFLICTQNGMTQSGCINGFIFNKDDSSAVAGAYIIMFEVNKTVTANGNGFFQICELEPREYSFGITLMGFKDTTISNLKVAVDRTDTIQVYLSTCNYHVLGKTSICPMCGRDDMVVPILYEVASKKMIKRAKKGTAYLGGHRTGCDPTYICKRDSIKY